jgi:hypothetical protein
MTRHLRFVVSVFFAMPALFYCGLWLHGPSDTCFRVPYCWLFILLFGALSVIPWMPWPNRFSLRTLLIVTTLVAVLLGLVVWLSS